MRLSTNQSARILADVGVARTQAQVLLAAGLAGAGMRSGGATLYEERAVHALANRSFVEPDDVDAACPHGLFIARIERSRRVDATTSWTELAADLSRQPPMPPLTRALLAARIAACGPLPWVSTLFGHVVLGADIVRVGIDTDGCLALSLTPPGGWFDTFEGRILTTSRGGRPWIVKMPRLPRLSE